MKGGFLPFHLPDFSDLLLNFKAHHFGNILLKKKPFMEEKAWIHLKNLKLPFKRQ